MKEFDRNIIVKYINAQYTEEELAQLVAWAKSSDDNARELFGTEQMHLSLKECSMPPEVEEGAMERMHGMLAHEAET